ncbi:MAG: hypothetical protein HRU11_04050 [Parvularculaceae bacterium]|nr:hypothetical protein [Parvularculaceae bacterium]
MRNLLTCAAAIAWLVPTNALAQRDLQVFEPAYFERFAPQTAEDMLNQVPGFAVRSTGGGRGLGQGGTNVLINGERITSKDTDVIDILRQTPAQTVQRIEITDAATLGVTGLNGQVANVVLDRSQISGSFEWEPTFRSQVKPRLTAGSVSVSGQAGKLDYTLGFENRAWRGFEEGPEERLDADGNLLDLREEHVTSWREVPRVTMALNYPFGEKTTLALTGSATSFGFEGRERSIGSEDSRFALNSEDEWNADLSAELTRELGPGALKLIGYQRYEHSPTTNRTRTVVADMPDVISSFDQEADEGETIARAEYAWQRDGAAAWEVAVETAYNFLDVDAQFTVEEDGTTDLSVFPNIRVEELRNQASVTRGFEFGKKLTMQASVAGEWSRLTVDSEGADREQTFLRPKGLVSFAYPWSDKIDIRGRVERTVGQLSFFQFIDSVDLTEDRDVSGNTQLVPQQAWVGEVEAEKRFGNDEKIVVRVIGELIEDRVERILIDGNDAVGNIDEAKVVRFETEGTLLLDRWSVTGGRIDFSYGRIGSRIEDPITGEQRGLNRVEDWFYRVDFRQDIPDTPYAWGGRVRDRDDTKVRRFNEIITNSESAPDYRLFVEHKDFFGFNLRLSGNNLANRDFDVNRVRYAGIRNEAPIELIERRSRYDNRRYQITLSGTF